MSIDTLVLGETIVISRLVFSWGPYTWDVDKAIKIASKKPVEKIRPKKEWIIHPITKKLTGKIDFEKPIIVGRDSNGREFILDGNHRATVALKKNWDFPVVKLTERETESCRI